MLLDLPEDMRKLLAAEWSPAEMLSLFQDERIYQKYKKYIPMILNKKPKRYIGLYLLFGGGWSSSDFPEGDYSILADPNHPGSTMTCFIAGIYNTLYDAILGTEEFLIASGIDLEDYDGNPLEPGDTTDLKYLYDNYGIRILEENPDGSIIVVEP